MFNAFAVLIAACLLVLPVFAQEAGAEGANVHAAPAMLKVQGNKVLTPNGKEVWLQGVNVPSLEWSPEGDNVMKSTEVAIADWKANVIRLPLSQDRWFGHGDRQQDGGKTYRELVDEVIGYCSARGVYVVLDLHWSNSGQWGKHLQQKNMPNEGSELFWRDVARRYRNNPAVLFDLYNEPRNVSWEVWRDGGVVENERLDDGTFTTYRTPGMQRLIDAIREEGARNIVLAGGLDWAYDLSGVLDGYALKDPSGNGIIYATHIYPWKSDWDRKVGTIAEVHPVFVGEVGCEPDKAQENPYTWGPDMIGYIQKRKLHWTAWCFHPSASPRMLQDFEHYTPTPYWGAFVKSALLGASYHLNRSR